MRAVITGCGGFIGSHLTERCLAEGWDVLGIDCFNDNYGRAQKLANLSSAQQWDAFEFIPVDLARGRLEDLVADCDVVFHLAAEPGVRPSWGTRFEQYVRNNVTATQLLLDAVLRTSSKPRLVYASSSSIYGSASEPVTEETVPSPFSPYGITKLTAEHLVDAYRQNFGVDSVSLRYFSVYGPRQRPDMAFHIFCQAAFAGERVSVFGDGSQTRDFTFVDDVVAATIAAGTTAELESTVYNVGAGHQVSVMEALELIESFTGTRLQVDHLAPEPGDVRHTAADASRARDELGWTPDSSFAVGLRAELDWLTATADRAMSGAKAGT